MAPRLVGRGAGLHRRQARGNRRTVRAARHRAVRPRRPVQRPVAHLRQGAGFAQLFQPRRHLRRQRAQRRALDLRLQPRRPGARLQPHPARGAVRPQHRRVADGQGGQGLHGGAWQRHALHLHRPARQRHGGQGDALLAGATEQRLRAEPGADPRGAAAEGLRRGLRRALGHRHGPAARRGEGHHARVAGAAHRRAGARDARIRRRDRRPGAARDLQPGLDDRAPQAVVLRQPHGADPECADGQPGNPRGLHHRQGARVLRPQEPEATGRARAGRDRAARRRCRHHAPDLGPGDRHAAPAVRGDGDRAALRHRRLHRLPPRPRDRDARRRGGQAGAGQGRAGRLDRRALFRDGLVLGRDPARIDLPGARQHPGPAARPGAGVHDARPGGRAALRQPPGVVDLPRDPASHGQDGSAGLRDHRGALELPARRHRRHRGRHARVGRRRAWPRRPSSRRATSSSSRRRRARSRSTASC